jgi:DNA primase
MSTFVDFKELKEKVSIDQVVAMLDLQLKRHGHQLRGSCPIHHGDSDREFVVTPSKGLFFCFGGCGGGDLITLVAKVKGIPLKDGAALIAASFGAGTSTVPGNRTIPRNSSPQPQPKQEGAARLLQPLSYLEPEHEAVQTLGISPETAAAFGAGYAPKGILRGRLAIPIHDHDGKLLAYCGRTVKNESPRLTFPNGFEPASVIFNCNRVTAGELYIVRDPLHVLAAFESGVENVVGFLTEGIAAQQLEMLAALMDEKKCETVELF